MQDDAAPPPRFARIRVKISVFFIVAVAGMIGVTLLVSYKQGVFVRHTSIYFYAADVVGMNKGMAVKLFGLPIGKVKEMDISDRGVKVELSINSDYTPRLPRGSTARMTREGYIGAASVQIVPPASSGGATLAEDDVIEFVPSRGLTEVMEEFKNQVTPIVNDLRRLLADVNRPEGEIRKSISAARTVLEQLPAAQQEARQLLRDADRAVLSAGRIGAQVEQQLPGITGKLATTLDSFSEAAVHIRDVTRDSREPLRETLRQTPALLREGEELVRDGREIAGAARNAWPLRNLMEERGMRTLPVDSFESAPQPSPAAGQR